MKLFILTFIATVSYVNAGKKQRMLAAMNGMNGGMAGGMNGGMVGGMNGGLMGGMNRGMANPGLMAGGLNPMVAGGGAGFIGQPQFAQFVPRIPAFAAPAPIPNVYVVPADNGFPFPQMAPQQPLMGFTGGAMQQQQFPLQPDPFRRFRRQIKEQDNTLKTTLDTQIPAPTETVTTAPCDDDDHHADN